MAEGAGASRPRGLFTRIVALGLVAVALAILVSLGTWQMQRLAWKEGLLSAIAERRSAPPVALPAIEAMRAEGGDIEYRGVTVTGVFDHANERPFLATFDGRSGYYIYTPLTLPDGRALFVNRGFVPFDNKDRATRQQGEVPGTMTVTGLARARLAGKPSSIVPDNDETKNIFYWKDLDAMARLSGLPPDRVLPFFVDADATPNPGGMPIGGVTQFDLPNSHLQYALTWYGLAVSLAVMTAILAFRRKR